MAKRKLTEKRRRFVDYFLGQAAGNATEAARLAGYAKPEPEGHRLLKIAEVRQAVESHAKTRARIKTRDERQEWWSKIMDDEDQPTKDRLRASELLAKSQADFVQRVEHSGKVDVDARIAQMSTDEIVAELVKAAADNPSMRERLRKAIEEDECASE
jgi:phage terminase small subunit